ncbi:MAG: TonB system transport protein TonB [Kluyvera sp.]
MTLDLPRRFPWPTLLSVGIHGAVVAGLLYTSVHQVIELPAPAQPITVTMVAPADLEPPQAVVQPQPVVEPEPEPEPEPIPEVPQAPVVIHKTKPKPKPKPKPVKKVEQPKPEVKPAEQRPLSTVNNDAPPARSVANNLPGASAPSVNAPTGPRALNRPQPGYPTRAQALRIEGKVRVKFDVTADGRVENVEILSAQPSNMFERDVKTAMRKWRYEAGKPGKGLIMNIEFRLKGVQMN